MAISNQADPQGGTMWIHKNQNFKLKYGSKQAIWETVPLADSVDIEEATIEDGMYLEPDGNGKYQLATEGAFPAYPILELKAQYDNIGVNGLTVAIGNTLAYTKQFTGDPSVGDFMQVGTDNKLRVVDTAGGDEENDAVARVTAVFNDYIEIYKLI